MRSVLTFLSLALLGTTASAQTSTWLNDSVSMGPGYSQDVYYNMGGSTVVSPPNNNWSLAFQLIPQIGNAASTVAIFANHVGGKVDVYSLHYSATAKFASLAAADTTGRITNPLYNSNTTWSKGALNRNNSTDPYDFSWGTYNPNTHNVEGDSLYLLKTPTASYKLWVQEYRSTPVDSIRYTFRIAAFDGSGDTTISIYRKDGFANSIFGYYDAPTRKVLSHEPGRNTWDIVFNRYKELVTQGPVTAYYPVAGVFQNIGVRVAKVRAVNRDSVNYIGQSYNSEINTIGSDWKYQVSQATPLIVDSQLTYFVRSEINQAYYQLSFTSFGGSATGMAFFKKRQVGSTVSVGAVANTNGPTAFILVPNPARNSNVEMMVDARTSETAKMLVTDAMGRTITMNTVALQAGLNGLRLALPQLATGTYFVTLVGGDWKQTQQLLIAE